MADKKQIKKVAKAKEKAIKKTSKNAVKRSKIDDQSQFPTLLRVK